MKIFRNDEGREYTVHAVCEFNKADREYYKNDTRRVCAYAVLESKSGECLVACGLNTSDWNNGIYFTSDTREENLEQAKACFEEKVASYLGE